MTIGPGRRTTPVGFRARCACQTRRVLPVLVAFAVRAVYLWLVTGTDPVTGDQVYYSAQAHMNATGTWFAQPFQEYLPGADHPPLTVALLTPISWVFRNGDFVLAQRWFNLAIGLVDVVLIGWIARRMVGERAARIVMVLAAIHASWWMGDTLVLSEPSAVLAVLLTIVGVLRLRERPGLAAAALCGAAGGLTALGRPEMALLIPLAVLPTAWVSGRSVGGRRASIRFTAVAAAAVLVVVGPWVAWNTSRFEDRALISTNDGFTLLGANCPTTYFGPGIGSYDIGCALSAPIPEGLDSSQASTIRTRLAVEYATDHLGRIPLVAAARFARLALVLGVGTEVRNAAAEGRPEWAMWIGVAQHWLLLPLAVAGWAVLRRDDRRLLMVVPLASLIAAVVIASYWRIRVPADIALLILAGAGSQRLLQAFYDRRQCPLDGAAAAG